MNKAISVSLAKIDYDFGKPYIKIIAHNPYGYKFTQFFLTVYSIEDGEWKERYFDASTTIADHEDIALRLPVESLSEVTKPSIYYITLKSENEGGELDVELYLSDIHDVYHCLLDGILNTSKCGDVDDDLIKKYLILYAHQQALTDGDIDVAKEMFKLMRDCFTKCGTGGRPNIKCGCNGKY